MGLGRWRWTRAVVAIATLAAAALLLVASPGGSDAAPPRVPSCTGGEALDLGCLAARYEALTRAAGPEAALADLGRRRGENGLILAACHQLTHVIGRTAGATAGIEALDGASELCSSGFHHGVVEAAMIEIGPADAVERAPTVCASFRDTVRHSNEHYNCVHGLGHGFMAVYGSDVFASLDGCDSLDDPWERDQCAGGVFMENLTSLANEERPSTSLRPDEPLYPCTAVDRRHKAACYEKQTAYAVYVLQDDFGAAFELCAATPDVAFRDDCARGLGGDIAIHTGKFVYGEDNRTAGIVGLCGLAGRRADRLACHEGAVTTIVRDLGRDDPSTSDLCDALRHRAAASCERARRHAVTALAAHPHDHTT